MGTKEGQTTQAAATSNYKGKKRTWISKKHNYEVEAGDTRGWEAKNKKQWKMLQKYKILYVSRLHGRAI